MMAINKHGMGVLFWNGDHRIAYIKNRNKLGKIFNYFRNINFNNFFDYF